MSEPATPRRVAWRAAADEAVEPRDRIIRAAARSMNKYGVDRTSISSIAREAGVSRQTIYSYFPNREAILREAVPSVAGEIIDKIKLQALHAATASDYVVEISAGAVEELLANQTVVAMMAALETEDGRRQAMGADIIAISRSLLEPLLVHRPDLEPHLDEMAETSLRWALSLLTYPSARTSTPDGLRSYLRRVLVPALGLTAP